MTSISSNMKGTVNSNTNTPNVQPLSEFQKKVVEATNSGTDEEEDDKSIAIRKKLDLGASKAKNSK